MRVERNRDGTHKVWMNRDEYDRLRSQADDYRENIVLRLGAEVGLRSHEIAVVRPEDIHHSSVVVDNHHRPVEVMWLRVPKGKDTRGAGGKARDAVVPDDVARDLLLYISERDLDQHEYLFQNPTTFEAVAPRTIQRWVSTVGDRAAASTGDEDYAKLTSHDLRRYFATQLLQEHGLNPEVLMDIGGWESYDKLKPYLEKPSEKAIVSEFKRIDLL